MRLYWLQDFLREVQDYLDDLLPTALRSTSSSAVGQWLRYLLLLLLGAVCRMCFKYSEDIVALAALVHHMPGEIFLANMAYEVLGGCTSVVVSDAVGKPMLARTMDWPMTLLAKYTVEFQWIRSSSDGSVCEPETLFYSVGWPGYVGVMTAVKPGRFSVSLNARYCAPCGSHSHSSFLVSSLRRVLQFIYKDRDSEAVREYEDVDVDEVLGHVTRLLRCMTSCMGPCGGGAWSAGCLIRHAMQSPDVDSFDKVVALFSQEPLASACYFIVAGVNESEGVVLTRDQSAVPVRSDSRRFMDDSSGGSCSNTCSGFVCQTNHDIPLIGDYSPDDFNSIDRIDIMENMLRSRRSGSDATRAVDVTKTLMTSILSKKGDVGVRMKMTLFCTVMCAHITSGNCLVTARATRRIGA